MMWATGMGMGVRNAEKFQTANLNESYHFVDICIMIRIFIFMPQAEYGVLMLKLLELRGLAQC
jgi:hypothetical protein